MSFDKLKLGLKGPTFPFTTPFDKNYGIDYDASKKYLDYLYDGGARIFMTMVHASRLNVLTPQEVFDLNSFFINYLKTNYSDCVVGVSDSFHTSTEMSVSFAKHAEAMGADFISLIFGERYYNDDQVYKHYETVANNCNIGILIHEQQIQSIYGTKHLKWPIDLLDRVASIDNVVAVKEDAKPGCYSDYEADNYTQEVINTLKSKVSIILSGGGKQQFLDFFQQGASGYLTAVGRFDPSVAFDFYNFCLKGDIDGCDAIIQKFKPVGDALKPIGWLPALKAAVSMIAPISYTERPPLYQLNEEELGIVKKVMEDLGYYGKT